MPYTRSTAEVLAFVHSIDVALDRRDRRMRYANIRRRAYPSIDQRLEESGLIPYLLTASGLVFTPSRDTETTCTDESAGAASGLPRNHSTEEKEAEEVSNTCGAMSMDLNEPDFADNIPQGAMESSGLSSLPTASASIRHQLTTNGPDHDICANPGSFHEIGAERLPFPATPQPEGFDVVTPNDSALQKPFVSKPLSDVQSFSGSRQGLEEPVVAIEPRNGLRSSSEGRSRPMSQLLYSHALQCGG